MRWGTTWQVGRVAGIPIRVHWSFGLLLALAALHDLNDPLGWWINSLYGLIVVVVVFFFVTLHELGHSLTARHLGVAIGDITLLPIGGLARIDLGSAPGWPGRELLITLAGPAVNLAIALALVAPTWLISGAARVGPWALVREIGHISPAGFMLVLIASNLMLAFFNLLPIYPMDGGRLVRALLGLRLSYVAATRWAVRVGQAISVLLALYGLATSRPGLTLLALVLIFAAAYELTEVKRMARLATLTLAEVERLSVPTIAPTTPLPLMAASRPGVAGEIVPVVEHGRLIGLVRATGGPSGQTAADVMETSYPVASETDRVVDVIDRLRAHDWSYLPVVAGDHYRGLVSLERLVRLAETVQ